jgi:hypothetical protein
VFEEAIAGTFGGLFESKEANTPSLIPNAVHSLPSV